MCVCICTYIYTVGILCGKCRKGNGVSALLGMCSECQETKQALIFAMGEFITVVSLSTVCHGHSSGK